MKISRHQMIAFAAVGREKSFSKAAVSLELGQSAITQHISSLEKTIGIQLFIRNRSGAQLTQAGRDLYFLADKMRVLEEQFYERANQYADLTAGSLSVCMSTPLPAMAIIAAFKHQFPGVDIDLQMAPWREAITKLHRRDIDIAIIMQPDSLEGLYAVEVERRTFVAILPKYHPLAQSTCIDIKALQKETLILLSQSSYTLHCVEKILFQQKIKWENTLVVSSYEMMLEAIIHGVGIGIALEGAQSHYQQVSTVSLKNINETHPYTVVCANDKAALSSVRGFFEIASRGAHSARPWQLNYSEDNN